MNNRQINECFMKLARRAERVEREKLVATFVTTGPLVQILSSSDNQIIYGRRGTGKTHALQYLADLIQEQGNFPIYVDMRTVGSNSSIYGDQTIPIGERATRLLLDVVSEIHDGLYGIFVDYSDRFDLSKAGPALDKIADAISQLRVVGATELQENTTDRIQSTYSSDLDLSASKTPHISLNIGSGSQTESEVRLSQKQSGKQIHYLHFGTLNRSLTEMSDLMQGGRVWLLLDEWSTIPLDLQVYLADLLRRCFFTINNFTVKIASIEHRTQLQTPLSGGAYIGIELGADAQANLNLDDFMVFDNDEMRAKEFFKALVFKHFRASEGLDADVGPQSGNDLISKAFTQITAFEEFVRAVEGVPRDAINIIESAAQRAFDERISVIHVRQAAHDWYVRDKARPIRDDEKAFALLNWIIDEVIGHRRARAFLLRADRKDPIVDKLFDARLIHLLKRSVATKDEPGVRYAVFKLDYGCYVDLINTQKQPIGLLQVDPEEEGAAGYVEVPPDDYRSIRRAILDLDRFRRSGAASSRIGSVEIGSVE